MATAGGLVFQGGGNRAGIPRLRCEDRREAVEHEGAHRHRRAADHVRVRWQQYVALSVGGNEMGGYYAPNYSRMLVFGLDGKAQLPPAEEYTPLPLDPPPSTASASVVKSGKEKYGQYCAACHGENGQTRGGNFPDLTRTPLLHTQEGFDQIVLQGVKADKGMASFASVLKPDDTLAIRSFIIERANDMKNNPPPVFGPAPPQPHDEKAK